MASTITFTLTEGDVGKIIQATLTDANGDAVDLTDSTSVKFHMTPVGSSEATIDADAEIVTPPGTDGVVKYEFQAADTAEPGRYSGEWYVEWGSALKEHFPTSPKYAIEIVSKLA